MDPKMLNLKRGLIKQAEYLPPVCLGTDYFAKITLVSGVLD